MTHVEVCSRAARFPPHRRRPDAKPNARRAGGGELENAPRRPDAVQWRHPDRFRVSLLPRRRRRAGIHRPQARCDRGRRARRHVGHPLAIGRQNRGRRGTLHPRNTHPDCLAGARFPIATARGRRLAFPLAAEGRPAARPGRRRETARRPATHPDRSVGGRVSPATTQPATAAMPMQHSTGTSDPTRSMRLIGVGLQAGPWLAPASARRWAPGLTMRADHALGPDQDQVPAPVAAAHRANHDPEELVTGAQPRSLPGPPGQHRELMVEQGILGHQRLAVAYGRTEQAEDKQQVLEHRLNIHAVRGVHSSRPTCAP